MEQGKLCINTYLYSTYVYMYKYIVDSVDDIKNNGQRTAGPLVQMANVMRHIQTQKQTDNTS